MNAAHASPGHPDTPGYGYRQRHAGLRFRRDPCLRCGAPAPAMKPSTRSLAMTPGRFTPSPTCMKCATSPTAGIAWIKKPTEPGWTFIANNFRYHVSVAPDADALGPGRGLTPKCCDTLTRPNLWDAESDEYLDLLNDASLCCCAWNCTAKTSGRTGGRPWPTSATHHTTDQALGVHRCASRDFARQAVPGKDGAKALLAAMQSYASETNGDDNADGDGRRRLALGPCSWSRTVPVTMTSAVVDTIVAYYAIELSSHRAGPTRSVICLPCC